MTSISFGKPGATAAGTLAYSFDTLSRRTLTSNGNNTRTDYAYEDDSDLDWMRHMFQGGATATAAKDSWMGIDYAYDKSARMVLTSSTDSRIIWAMHATANYGAANMLNQVANVGRPSLMTWSEQ